MPQSKVSLSFASREKEIEGLWAFKRHIAGRITHLLWREKDFRSLSGAGSHYLASCHCNLDRMDLLMDGSIEILLKITVETYSYNNSVVHKDMEFFSSVELIKGSF